MKRTFCPEKKVTNTSKAKRNPKTTYAKKRGSEREKQIWRNSVSMYISNYSE